jgi:predicted solute-binding protein
MDELISSIEFPAYSMKKYYHENIRYELNEERRKGMTLFLKQIEQG